MTRTQVNKRKKEIDGLVLLLTDKNQLIALKAERKNLVLSDMKRQQNRKNNPQLSSYMNQLSDLIKERMRVGRKLGLTTKNQRKRLSHKINKLWTKDP